MGEESAMTVRAFTHGYELFHPAETILWHDYRRLDSRRHWTDHGEDNLPDRPWNTLDERSRGRIQALLGGADLGPFGLGLARSLEEYERYAGLSFRLRKAQNYTMEAKEPPNPQPDPDWTNTVYPWIVQVSVEVAQLQPEALQDPELWCVSILDEDGCELYRRDLLPDELGQLRPEQGRIVVICEFPAGLVPAQWSIWPLSRSRGWLGKFGARLQDEAFAVVAEPEGDVSVAAPDSR